MGLLTVGKTFRSKFNRLNEVRRSQLKDCRIDSCFFFPHLLPFSSSPFLLFSLSPLLPFSSSPPHTLYLNCISTTDLAGIEATTWPLFSFAFLKSDIETSSFLPKSLYALILFAVIILPETFASLRP